MSIKVKTIVIDPIKIVSIVGSFDPNTLLTLKSLLILHNVLRSTLKVISSHRNLYSLFDQGLRKFTLVKHPSSLIVCSTVCPSYLN